MLILKFTKNAKHKDFIK